MARLTLATVKARLRPHGLSVDKSEGEYAVYPRGANRDHPVAYFTDDLDDALGTGLAMARLANPRKPRVRRGRQIGTTASGQSVRDVSAAIYQTRVRLSKWNDEPTMTSGYDPRIGRRLFPGMTKQDHFEAALFHARRGAALQQQHYAAVRAAVRKYGPQPRHISAGVGENFPEAVNDRIRSLAQSSSREFSASVNHYQASGKRKHWREGVGIDAIEAAARRKKSR